VAELNRPPPLALERFPKILHRATCSEPNEQIPAPFVGLVLIEITESAIAIVPSLWIPPPLQSETVTPLNVAFPELQTPALGLEMTDEELTCSMPVD
jgi:hypothetical protein